jgi:hypothetical protein
VPEPRYVSESWRWVTSEDGLGNTLVAGPELLPLPRVILECGIIDAEDADLIATAKDMFLLLSKLQLMLEDEESPRDLVDDIETWDRLYEDITELLAKIRPEVSDA